MRLLSFLIPLAAPAAFGIAQAVYVARRARRAGFAAQGDTL
jgi:hypothetical protein